jgi:ribonuclease P protein component
VMNSPGKNKRKSVTAADPQLTPPDEIKIKTKYGYLTLAINPQNPDLKIRILIKKVVGNAVQRNYYKRLLRQYLRDNRSRFIRYNDCVFYYHSKVRASFHDIQDELNNKISGLA